MPDPNAPATTPTPEPAKSNEGYKSFADALDARWGDLKEAEPAADPAAPPPPAAPTPAPTPAAVVPPVPAAPASATPAAPTPAVPFDETAADELFKTKAGDAFKLTKGRIKDLAAEVSKKDQELAALRADLETAKKAPAAAPADLEAVRKEADDAKKLNAQYEAELYKVKVEATQEFQSTIEQPMKALKERVQTIAAKIEGTSANQIFAALDETDQAKQDQLLAEIAGSLPQRDQWRLYQALEDYQGLAARKATVKDNARAAFELIQSKQQTEVEQLRTEVATQYSTGKEKELANIHEHMPFLKQVDGNDDWNKFIAGFEQHAKAIKLGELTPEGQAAIAVRGAYFPALVETLNGYIGLIQGLQAKVAKYEGATPAVGGGGQPPATPAPKPATPGGFLDRTGTAAGVLPAK